MDQKKICIIMCSNEKEYELECKRFIDHLIIPDGFSLDVCVISDADSMTAGYNKAMSSSDAKYKIYIHHDVFIVYENMLNDLLKLFEDSSIGIVGQVGVKNMPSSGVMWDDNGRDNRIGRWIQGSINDIKECVSDDFSAPYEVVDAVDGFFIATQYDIPWREDIFDGWDFYDVSQSYEFKRAGYKVIVPKLSRSWCLHDTKVLNLRKYYDYRDIFLKEYFGTAVDRTEDNYDTNYTRADIFESKIDEMLWSHTDKDFDVLHMLFSQEEFLIETVKYSSKLMYTFLMIKIISKEKRGMEDRYIMECHSIEEFIIRWRKLRFLMFEKMYLKSKEAEEEVRKLICEFDISDTLLDELRRMVS